MADLPRDLLLREIDAWREEGILDERQHATLRARYEGQDAGARRSGFAADWLQLVGGLLLGAALVALVAYVVGFDGSDATRRSLALLGLGAVSLLAAIVLHIARGADKPGLVDALLAAALVPAAVSAPSANEPALRWIAALALVPPLAALALRRGRSPVTALATVGFALASFFTIGDEIFSSSAGARPFLWETLLLAYGALLLAWRREGWTSVSLALLVLPLALALVAMLNSADVDGSHAIELWMGAYLGAILGLGVALGQRGLVAGAAAGLTIDAVVFAADLGGALSALLVLAALGGLLVWQAEVVRGYFRRRAT